MMKREYPGLFNIKIRSRTLSLDKRKDEPVNHHYKVLKKTNSHCQDNSLEKSLIFYFAKDFKLREKVKTRSRRDKASPVRLFKEKFESIKEENKMIDKMTKFDTVTSLISSFRSPYHVKTPQRRVSVNRQPDLFFRKKRPTLQSIELNSNKDRSCDKVSTINQFVSSHTANIPSNTIVKTLLDVEKMNKSFKLNTFFKRKTSIISQNEEVTDIRLEINSQSTIKDSEDKNYSKMKSFNVTNNGARNKLPNNLASTNINYSDNKSNKKNIETYINEYRGSIQNSKINTLRHFLSRKLDSNILCNVTNYETNTDSIHREGLLSVDGDNHINKSTFMHDSMNERPYKMLLENHPRTPATNTPFKIVGLKNKSRKINRFFIRSLNGQLLLRAKSKPDSKAKSVFEAISELQRNLEIPKILSVDKSKSVLSNNICVGCCENTLGTYSVKDEVNQEYAIDKMIWYSNTGSIKGFKIIYAHKFNDKIKEGSLHGSEWKNYHEFKIENGDKLKSIYFYCKNTDIQNLKFVTVKNQILTVGTPLEEIDDLDQIYSHEFPQNKNLQSIVSYSSSIGNKLLMFNMCFI